MPGAQADVGCRNPLGHGFRVDPQHAHGPAQGFGRGDLVGGCVWTETGEGSRRDAEEEGDVGEGSHVAVDLFY